MYKISALIFVTNLQTFLALGCKLIYISLKFVKENSDVFKSYACDLKKQADIFK